MRTQNLWSLASLAVILTACGDPQNEVSASSDSSSQADGTRADAPAQDTAASGLAPAFCPAYVDSGLYRARARHLTVGPADNWIGAIRGAVSGTEILLRDGTYDFKGLYALTVPANVTLRGLSGNAAGVTLRNVGYGTPSEGVMIVGANVTIADLTIREMRDHAVTVKGELGANAVQLYNLSILDIGTQQIAATAGSQGGVVACSRFGYTAGRQRGDAVGAIALHGASGWTLRDNRVTGVVGDGTGCAVDTGCGTHPRGPAIEVGDASRGILIERNTLLNNYRGIALGANEGGTVRNNFILRRVPGLAGVELAWANSILLAHNTVRVLNYANAIEAQSSKALAVVNNFTTGALLDLGAAPLNARGNLTNAVDADFKVADSFHVRDGDRVLGAGVRLDAVTMDMDGDLFADRWDVGADHGVALVAPPAPPTAAPPPPAAAVNFCPPYVRAPEFRPRAHQSVVGPADNWMDTIENAAAGTEVLLRDGVYLHTRYTVRIPAEVTVRGQSGNRDAVLIRGQGFGPGAEAFFFMGPNITVADLSMTQFRNYALSIKGEYNAQAPNVYNVHLYDIGTKNIKVTPGWLANGLVACSSIGNSPGGGRGDYVDGFDMMQGIDWVLRDNEWYNITGDGTGCEVDANCGTYMPGPAILIWRESRGSLIERNVFIGNFRGIVLGLGTPDEGSIVRNNFIYRAGAGDVGIGLHGANNALVTNNTILSAQYRAGIEVWEGSNVTVTNNFVNTPLWDRGGNTALDARGNLWNAARADFVGDEDYHLVAGDRAIGAGVPVSTVTDMDGEAFSGRDDVGCDRYTP